MVKSTALTSYTTETLSNSHTPTFYALCKPKESFLSRPASFGVLKLNPSPQQKIQSTAKERALSHGVQTPDDPESLQSTRKSAGIRRGLFPHPIRPLRGRPLTGQQRHISPTGPGHALPRAISRLNSFGSSRSTPPPAALACTAHGREWCGPYDRPAGIGSGISPRIMSLHRSSVRPRRWAGHPLGRGIIYGARCIPYSLLPAPVGTR